MQVGVEWEGHRLILGAWPLVRAAPLQQPCRHQGADRQAHDNSAAVPQGFGNCPSRILEDSDANPAYFGHIQLQK